MKRSLARRSRSACGYTLIELLWAMVLSLVLAGAGMSFLIVSIDQQNAISSRTAATTQAQAGLEQLIRDLRQAMATDASGNALTATVSTNAAALTTSVTFDIPTPGNDTVGQLVTWSCPSAAEPSQYVGACTRSIGAGSATRLIAGVQSMTFTPVDSAGAQHALSTTVSSSYTNPASVGVTLDVQVVSQLDATQPASHILRATANPIVIQAAADLRNFA